jgi:hypothetical protein
MSMRVLEGEKERAALAGFWWGQRPYCLIDNEAGDCFIIGWISGFLSVF